MNFVSRVSCIPARKAWRFSSIETGVLWQKDDVAELCWSAVPLSRGYRVKMKPTLMNNEQYCLFE